MDMDERMWEAIARTEVVRPPRRRLSTFGTTTVEYYVVTALGESMTCVRDGTVFAERPRIVTPYYLLHVEGFSDDARRYLSIMAEQDAHAPGVLYAYRNNPLSANVVSEPIVVVTGNLESRLDAEDRPLAAIIRGVEDMWDLAVMIFIYDLTQRAVGGNVADFRRRGLLSTDSAGVPVAARDHIEALFAAARADRSRAAELVSELRRWGLYEEYEDRFLAMFK